MVKKTDVSAINYIGNLQISSSSYKTASNHVKFILTLETCFKMRFIWAINFNGNLQCS
jgi:hypothetical protein